MYSIYITHFIIIIKAKRKSSIFASLAYQRGLFETSETESWKETIETKMLVENN